MLGWRPQFLPRGELTVDFDYSKGFLYFWLSPILFGSWWGILQAEDGEDSSRGRSKGSRRKQKASSRSSRYVHDSFL